jgi:hypothetical protein
LNEVLRIARFLSFIVPRIVLLQIELTCKRSLLERSDSSSHLDFPNFTRLMTRWTRSGST